MRVVRVAVKVLPYVDVDVDAVTVFDDSVFFPAAQYIAAEEKADW